MKRFRVVCLVAFAAGLLALILWLAPRRPPGFATPAECLEAYAEASRAGDVEHYLGCLTEPLRSENRPSATPAGLRRQTEGVKSWVQLDPVVEGQAAHIDVDQVRRDGTRRVRFHLRRGGGGWLIAGIDPPKALATDIPYGTPIDQVPEGGQPPARP